MMMWNIRMMTSSLFAWHLLNVIFGTLFTFRGLWNFGKSNFSGLCSLFGDFEISGNQNFRDFVHFLGTSKFREIKIFEKSKFSGNQNFPRNPNFQGSLPTTFDLKSLYWLSSKCSKMFLSGFLIRRKAAEMWWFSNTDWSLYSNASSDFELIWNWLFVPFWKFKNQKDLSSAKKFLPIDHLSTNQLFR